MNNKCCFLISVTLSWQFVKTLVVSLIIGTIRFYTEPSVAAKVIRHPMGYFVRLVALSIGRSRFLIVCYGLCVGFPSSLLISAANRLLITSYFKYQIYFGWWINHTCTKQERQCASDYILSRLTWRLLGLPAIWAFSLRNCAHESMVFFFSFQNMLILYYTQACISEN